jgi:hypothetical protein
MAPPSSLILPPFCCSFSPLYTSRASRSFSLQVRALTEAVCSCVQVPCRPMGAGSVVLERVLGRRDGLWARLRLSNAAHFHPELCHPPSRAVGDCLYCGVWSSLLVFLCILWLQGELWVPVDVLCAFSHKLNWGRHIPTMSTVLSLHVHPELFRRVTAATHLSVVLLQCNWWKTRIFVLLGFAFKFLGHCRLILL